MKTHILSVFLLSMVAQICFAQGYWTQIDTMPEIRYAHTVNELNGKIYVVGGLNTETSVYPRTALVYDTSSGIWTQIPLCNNKIRAAHNSCVVGGRLYVMGGNDSSSTVSTMDMFDPNSGQWVSKNSMSTDRGLAACVSIGGKIYVIGGMRFVGISYDYTGLRTVEVYDTNSGTWTQLADMPTARWGHSAGALNGKIYVFGGVSGAGHSGWIPYSSVEVYNPQTDTWTTKSNMPTNRYCLSTCVLDRSIYTIGGWYNSGGGPIYDKVEVYDPERDTWFTETPMPVKRAVLASIVVGGRIYVYGGARTTHPNIGTSAIYEFETNVVPVEPASLTVHSYLLCQNYPNPFNPSTTIKYELPKATEVKLSVYDVLGREVSVLVNERKNAGSYEVQFNASNLASAVYFYRIQAGDYTQTRKLCLIR
jgi:N-acetylneuraminic acid mutarotase